MLKTSFKAPFNCDSVEVSPALDKVFVGMYEYEESSSTRGGGFLLTDADGNRTATVEGEFGCLDAKWLDNSIFVIACSDGLLRWYDSHKQVFAHATTVVNSTTSSTDNILMTVDTVGNTTAAISAKGSLAILEGQDVKNQWEAHSPVYESWCCGLSPNADVVVTGSDDCALKYWDVRTGELTHHDRRNHTMGTTCIEFLDDHTLLSGSYDERVRKFDTRNLSIPVSEFRSIGGIWRLKVHQESLYIAACYGGCQVVTLDGFEPVVPEYRGHESMAYGIGALGNGIVVSCSFYDRSVQFWSHT